MVITKENFHMAWLGLVALLFVFHYIQPQTHISALASFAPYTLLTVGCVFFLFITRNNILQWAFPQMRYIWMLFGLLFIITVFAEAPRAHLGAARFILMYVPFMLSVLIVVNSISRLKIAVNLLIGVTVFTSIITILFVDETGGDTGNGSFLMNANEFALFAGMVVPYCYYMVLFETQLFRKLLYVIALGIISLAIVTSFSRAGLLGVACAGLVILWFSPRKTPLMILGAIVICIGVYVGGEQYMNEMSTITDIEQSTSQIRLQTWKDGWNKFLNNPFGSGLTSGRTQISRNSLMEVHSIWLVSLIETGIIGFWMFIMIWYVNIYDSLSLIRTKATNDEQKFLKLFGMSSLASLAAYASAGSVTHAFHYPHFWYISIFIAAASKIWINTSRKVNQ